MDQRQDRDASASTNRRDFLQQAAGLTAGVAALSPTARAADEPVTAPTLPTIRLGPHEVTRLIIGGNPIYGYSHHNHLFSNHLTDWHTPERVLDLWRRCEQCGLNAFQNSYAERTLADVDRYRAAGRLDALALPGQARLGPPPRAHRRRREAPADRHRPPRGAQRAAAPREEVRRADRPAQAHPRPGRAGGALGPRPDADRGGRRAGLGRGLLHVLALLPDPAQGGVPGNPGRDVAPGRDLPAVGPAEDVPGDPGDGEALPGLQDSGGGPADRQPGGGAAVLRGGVRRDQADRRGDRGHVPAVRRSGGRGRRHRPRDRVPAA